MAAPETPAGRAGRHRVVAAVAAGLVALLVVAGCQASTSRPQSSRSGGSGLVSQATSGAAPASSGRATSAHSDPSRSPSSAPAVVSAARVSGEVLQRNIRATGGFQPRPALIYLPPVLRTHPSQRLPVLELLHGTPGQPSDWLTRGGLRSTADAFAAAHHGLAPIVVLPDLNGAQRADSECIRTANHQNVESYLTQDVVSYVRQHYARSVGHSRWWIAGLSEGGICATMLALRHPTVYSAFGDFSGLAVPTVDHLSRAASDQQLYGGSQTARLEHDPRWLLKHRHYTGLRGWFECGASDTEVRRAQNALVAAARAVGLPVVAHLLPGKHYWSVWSGSLRASLPWFWAHGV